MIQSISIMFLLCIITRLFLIYCVYLESFDIMMMMIYSLIAIGLLYQYLVNNRKLGAFNQKVWWQSFRLFHALIYIFIVILLYFGKSRKVVINILLLDIIVAIIGHIYYNYIK